MTEENFDLLMAKASSDGLLTEIEQDEGLDKTVESPKVGDTDFYEYDPDEPSTCLHILYEKDLKGNNADFVECCQHTGIISKNATCPYCSIQMILIESTDYVDGVVWSCPTCYSLRSVSHGSWFEDFHQVPLKYLLPILYCWCLNAGELMCQMEMAIKMEKMLATFIYNRCNILPSEFFKHEICTIGSKDEFVEIEEFATPAGLHVIGGVERKNLKNVFFRVLPENWTRDDLVTAICDNVESGSILHIQNSTLLDILEDIGLEYLLDVWGIKVETSSDPENSMVRSLWTLFEKLFENKNFTETSIFEFLFRRRMEASRDPLLYLLSVIARLHPPPDS